MLDSVCESPSTVPNTAPNPVPPTDSMSDDSSNDSSNDTTSTDKPTAAMNGLGKIAMALIQLIHELLEKQAIRRMENGTLTDDEIERVGSCLMEQSKAIDQLCAAFGLDRKDLAIDLGPLGKLV